MSRVCTKCKKEKELEAFYKNKKFKDNYHTQCKDCLRKAYKEWELKNKEHRKNYHKKYRENNKEVIKERKKRTYNKNKTHYKQYEKEYYEKNKEKIFKKTKERIEKSPIKITYASIHRYIRKIKLKPQFCIICNERKQKLDLASINHIYTRDPKDYIYLCRSCHPIYEQCRRKKELEEVLKK